MQNALVERDDRGLVQVDWNGLLTRPVEDLTDGEVFAALSLCDLGSKAMGDRAKALKARASQAVETIGENHTAQTRKLALDGVEVHVTTPAPKVTINEVALRLLLQKRGLPVSMVFDTVTKEVLNETSLEQLIASGEFSDDDIESFTSEKAGSPRLSVKKHVGGLTKADLLGG